MERDNFQIEKGHFSDFVPYPNLLISYSKTITSIEWL